MLNDRHYDIIIFTETWLNNSVTNAMLNPLNLYTVYRLDRPDNARGGGIIVYVNINYNSLCMTEFVTNGIELLCITFFNYRLVTIYRSPNMPLSQTVLLCDTLNNICSSTDSCLIYGDFNLAGIDWIAGTTSTIAERYVYNKFISYGLTQLINFNSRNSNILDLILTNNTLIISNISPTSAFEYDAHISDHFAIYSDLVIPDNYLNSGNLNHNKCSIQRLNYNKSDIASIKTHILSLDWTNILSSCNDCNELINTFIIITKNIIELYTPTFSTKIYKYPLSIKKLLNKCRVLHRNIIDTDTHNVWRYNQYLLSDKIKQYNIEVEHKMLSSNKKSSFYNYINTKLNNKNLIPPLRNRVDHNIIYTNDFDKADCLSDQFSSVFLKSLISYDPSIMKDSRFNDFPISQEIVRKFLCKLPPTFNSSPDGLPKGMLKLLSYEISYPLSIVFQRILDEGQCPTIWKLANIIPIFKKGNHSLPSNYRPISLLPSTLIIFEKILSYYLLYYLRSNKLLCTEQYGFLAGRSTELQLIEFYRNISRATNHSFNTDIIYIDMAKAFDKVCHSKLLKKISKLEIGGNVLKWLIKLIPY